MRIFWQNVTFLGHHQHNVLLHILVSIVYSFWAWYATELELTPRLSSLKLTLTKWFEWREPCWHEGSPVGMKGGLLAWREPCWHEGSPVGMKRALLAWREPCWQEKSPVDMKGALLAWREPCWQEGSPVGMKRALLAWREPCWHEGSPVGLYQILKF
jgi:hypothetical protein